MAQNDFLPFCPTDTGSNLLTESAYLAASDRTNGNQPGVASAKLMNKALRQSTYVAGQLAQFMSDQTGADLLDDGTPLRLLAQIKATFKPLNPIISKYTAGSGSHNLTYKFMVVSASATVGATYSDGTTTYTVAATIASGVQLNASGSAAPFASGTLTKLSGTGDATITVYAVRAPLYLRVRAVGAGGGGGGGTNGSSGTAGGAGGNTTFGTTLIVCGGGGGGGVGAAGGGGPGSGGTASLGTGPIGIATPGGGGGCVSMPTTYSGGGMGGVTPFGGGGAGGFAATAGVAGATNSGSGGGGGAGIQSAGAGYGGGGGGAGGFVDAIITSPLSTYTYAIGAAGSAGGANGGSAGALGAAGLVEVTEYYQ